MDFWLTWYISHDLYQVDSLLYKISAVEEFYLLEDDSMQLKPLVDEFLKYLEIERGCSQFTVKAYYSDLNFWLQHLESEGIALDLQSVTPQVLRGYIAALSTAGLKPATIARRFNAIRSLWNYIVDCEYTERNPCRRIVTPKRELTLPIYLSLEEAEALLSATDKNHYIDLAFRDRAIIATFVYTGVRRSELLALRLGDIDLEYRILHVRRGKGGKERTIPIVEPLVQVLKDYLELRPDTSHDRLFCTREKHPLGKTGLTALFQKAVRNSGIDRPGITMHKLRHTFATMLLKAGIDLVSIQRLLGHNSIETTSIYLHVDMSDLRKAVAKLPTLGGSSFDPQDQPGIMPAHD